MQCDVMQYPISFALNLAIPTDKAIGAKQVYCASPTSPTKANDTAGMKDTGGKGDEADANQLKVGAVGAVNGKSSCFTFVLY